MSRVEITETALTTHDSGVKPRTERRRTFVAKSNQAAGIDVRVLLDFAEAIAEHSAPHNVKVQFVGGNTAPEPRIDQLICTWSQAIDAPEDVAP